MRGSTNLWRIARHGLEYLRRADSIPHRIEGEAVLLECLPARVSRVLDLGSGDGRLVALVKRVRPQVQVTALDFSALMLKRLRKRFAANPSVRVVEHDMARPLPELGRFDAVVSSFAIHHLEHRRKRRLYAEAFAMLAPGGVFCNLDHVSSPTAALHRRFLQKLGIRPGNEDPSNKLLDLQTQLNWLRQSGFGDVDCHWKWLELALLAGRKPGTR